MDSTVVSLTKALSNVLFRLAKLYAFGLRFSVEVSLIELATNPPKVISLELQFP